MARHGGLSTGGTLILDSQGLSLYLDQDRRVMAIVRSALDRGAVRTISGVTLVETVHRGIARGHWNYVLSQLDIQSMSVQWFREAADLIVAHGAQGHKYAIDAMVAVTATHQPGPVVMLTSGADDMSRFCGDRVTIVAV